MYDKVNLRICLTISMFLLVTADPAQAATITVGPGTNYDFDTIQAGIDAAVDGDTVLVAPDEFVITEPITFRGKPITVKSEAGPGETTIRMGTPTNSNRASVVIFENNEVPLLFLKDSQSLMAKVVGWLFLMDRWVEASTSMRLQVR